MQSQYTPTPVSREEGRALVLAAASALEHRPPTEWPLAQTNKLRGAAEWIDTHPAHKAAVRGQYEAKANAARDAARSPDEATVWEAIGLIENEDWIHEPAVEDLLARLEVLADRLRALPPAPPAPRPGEARDV